jgi:2-polyprenyl-3-methyl-5-hydroxy-6-metoxy-1,4-benzoquinol methylase
MEKDSLWYDEAYNQSAEYRKEPEDSIYYHVWKGAIKLIKNERIVDFGCGPGQFAKLLLKKGKRFVYGVDFSSSAISLAAKSNPEHSAKFRVRDLLKDFKLPAHDLVVCFEVLEHIEKDLDVVKKIQSGKRFIFSVPNYDYKSHVRKFETAEEILLRYGGIVDIKSIQPFKMSDKNIIWLVDSVKM